SRRTLATLPSMRISPLRGSTKRLLPPTRCVPRPTLTKSVLCPRRRPTTRTSTWSMAS
ncbi:hypothetical protein EV181_005672, partial [Coemansia sp. RSA 532]